MNARDRKIIYLAHFIGRNTAHRSEYTTPVQLKSVVTDGSTVVQNEDVARIKDYDIEVYIPRNQFAVLSNENSILWVYNTPNSKLDNFDYIINKKPNVLRNGDVILYCRSVENNTIALYYCNDSTNIYSFNMSYDKQTNIAEVPANTYIPITTSSVIWLAKPTSIDSTNGKMLVDKIETTANGTRVFMVSANNDQSN